MKKSIGAAAASPCPCFFICSTGKHGTSLMSEADISFLLLSTALKPTNVNIGLLVDLNEIICGSLIPFKPPVVINSPLLNFV